MKATLVFALACLILFSNEMLAQPFYTKKDLSHEWLVFKDQQYVPFSESESDQATVYFRLEANASSDYLMLKSPADLNLFINGSIVGVGKYFVISVDSIAKVFASRKLLFTIHQVGKNDFETLLVSRTAPDSAVDTLVKRDASSFRDFGIMAGLLLVIFIVTISRLNPKLALDYLSVPRVFSLRDGDDSQMYARIATSANILFYVFCSMLISYYLIVAFHFVSDVYPAASTLEVHSFSGLLLQWLKLSAIIFLLLFIKIIIVFSMAFLFQITEISGPHLFNWMRLLIVMLSILTIVLFIYFVSHGQRDDMYILLLRLLGWIIAGWMILIFFKLTVRVNASLFHLFSYICATELIPFLLILKVLYN